MSSGIIGRKVGMTQVVAEGGERVPVTVIQVEPCVVVQKKSVENDGYSAIQIGSFEKKASLCSKPEKGHFNKAKVHPTRYLREIRVEDSNQYEIGQAVTVDIFNDGDVVDVAGISKGKGFAGAMKRWGFGGGRASHGAEKVHRKVGSIGNSADPAKVFKGKKMPGRMGNERVTVQNISLFQVRADENILLLKGAVPGHKEGLLLIKKAIKKG